MPMGLLSKPSRSDAVKFATLDVQYEIEYGAIPQIQTPDDYRNSCVEAGGITKGWVGVKGLRTKLFTFQESTGKGGGIYTFFTKADLDAYMASDLFKGFGQSPFIKKGTLKYLVYENLPGGELCSEMCAWPSGNKRPTESDIATAHVFFPHFNIKYGAIKEINNLDDYSKGAGMFATVPWMNLPGLRTKWFTMHRESETCHGIYFFQNKAALDSYLKSDLFRRFVKQPWLINPDPQVWEVLKGSELTIEMGEYKGEKQVSSCFAGIASKLLCKMIDGGLPPKSVLNDS